MRNEAGKALSVVELWPSSATPLIIPSSTVPLPYPFFEDLALTESLVDPLNGCDAEASKTWGHADSGLSRQSAVGF